MRRECAGKIAKGFFSFQRTTAVLRLALVVLAAAWSFADASEHAGFVSYMENTENAFSGEVKEPVRRAMGSSPSEELSVSSTSFSSVLKADRSIDIHLILINRGKIFSAYVDPEGDIMQMRGEYFSGRVAALEPEDREELRALARALRPVFDDAAPVRERFGRFANFLIGAFPTGIPVDWKFEKKRRPGPTTPAATVERCTSMSGYTMARLFRSWFMKDLRNHRLDSWLIARGWRYDEATDSVCGLSDTRICSYVGRQYRGKPGWVTTAPLKSSANLGETPHETTFYNGNLMAIATIGMIPGTTEWEYCAGRCGPGCAGAAGDFFSMSDFHLSAECFAHDACLGEVGSDWLSSVGSGHACADEFLNASWGYLNGGKCDNASKASLVGWWSFAADGESLYRLDADGSVKSWSMYTYWNEGKYVANVNNAGERWILLKEEETTGPGRVFTGKIGSKRPHVVSGNFSTDDWSGAPVKSFAACKVNLTGIVYDSFSKKPVKDVVVTIEGDTLDKVKRWHKTDSKGFFGFYSLSPHDTYTFKLSKTDYITFEKELKASRYPVPQKFKLVPAGFAGRTETEGGRIDWVLRGPDPEKVWEGEWHETVRFYYYVPPEDGTPVTFAATLTPYSCCEDTEEQPASHHFFMHEFGTLKSVMFACPKTLTRSITKEFVLSGDGNIDAAFFALPCGPQYGFVQVSINPHPGPPPAASSKALSDSRRLVPGDVRAFTVQDVLSLGEEPERGR